MKDLISMLFLTLWAGILQAQTFEFVLKDTKESEARVVCEMNDNYIIGGTYEKMENRATFANIIKLDHKGDTIWTRKIGKTSEGRDGVVDLLYLDDQQFIVLSDLNKKVTVSLLDQSGKEHWTYTDSLANRPVSITQTKDGGVAVCGACRSKSANSGRPSICVIKLDKNGKHLWSKFIGQGEQLKSYTIAATPGGGILVNARHREEQIYDPHLILLNAEGKMIWQKSIASYGVEYAFDMEVDLKGNIYLTGEFSDRGLPTLIKLDRDGNLLWKHKYEYEGETGNFRAYAVALTKDQGCILAGRTTNARGFLLKTDQKGNQQWLRIFTGIEKAGFKDVIQLKAGGYMAVGITLYDQTLNTYIIKTDEKGNF